MKLKYFIMNIVFIIVLTIFGGICNAIEPFSMAFAGIAVYAAYNYESIGKYTVCKYYECCIENYIPGNINELQNQLNENVFGQHIVMQQLIPALRGHFDQHSNPKKPLVISFHGTPGTGKNFVSDFIVKALFKNGLKSRFVHKFVGQLHFPEASHVPIYKEKLNTLVRNAIKQCPRSLFIFDEVDKIPAGVLDSITSLLDHHTHLDGYDFRKSIFIFLSNTAGVEISNQLSKLMKSGILRENTKLHDFEKILEINAYNSQGGLHKASIIETHLVDHFIPFLPLEKVHIKQCLEAEFRRLQVKPTK